MNLDLNGMTITRRQRQGAVRAITQGLNRLNEHGWCQGSYGNIHRGYCAIGAVGSGSGYTDSVVTNLLCAGIRKVTPSARISKGSSEGRIVGWNDRKGRTASEVKRAFRHAIKIGENLKPVQE